MTEPRDSTPERPPDPAGTRPKVDPDSLVPARTDPLVAPAIDTTAVEDDSEHRMLPERVALGGAPALATRDEAPHAPRFQFLFGALAALGLAALAAVVALAASGGKTDGPKGPTWSEWQPTPGSASAPEQIARHIGGEYHLATGDQLVLVTGGPLEVADLQLTIALRQTPEEGGDISLIDGKGVLYRLCGLGPKCSINKGKPSAARKLLLHREALELALYTFRYTDADHVVALMPPGRPKKNPKKILDPNEALFFRRGDVGPALSQPVTATLTRTAPIPSTFTRSPDSDSVVRLTEPRIFEFTVSPANADNRAYLVLQRFTAAAQ